MTLDDELCAIARALSAILSALLTDPAPASATHAPQGPSVILLEPYQADAADLIANPLGSSLRLGIRALGERLNEVGGSRAMRAALDLALDDTRDGRETCLERVVDRTWHGIGAWAT